MKCYLCEKVAIVEDHRTEIKELIKCQECGKYTLTESALLYYFRQKDKQILTKEDKKKLSEYVKKHYDVEKDEAVSLDTKIIERITRKRSENVRYR